MALLVTASDDTGEDFITEDFIAFVVGVGSVKEDGVREASDVSDNDHDEWGWEANPVKVNKQQGIHESSSSTLCTFMFFFFFRLSY